MSTRPPEQLVAELGVPHRARTAKWTLIFSGAAVRPAIHAGLADADPAVVLGCIDVIDHILDGEDLGPLLGATAHPSAEVRARALHALFCENCKQGTCRPAEDEVVLALLRGLHDEDRNVRAVAVEGLSIGVHRWPAALPALQDAAASDPHPSVRKKAALAVPGGPIYEGRRTKSGRLRPRPPASLPA